MAAARFLPAVRFIRFSVAESISVCPFIRARRFSPCPYWSVSESPRRLSRTKPLKFPESLRNCIPASPLTLEVTNGITSPTVRYADSARIPNARWKEPINRHRITVYKPAIIAGEIVCA